MRRSASFAVVLAASLAAALPAAAQQPAQLPPPQPVILAVPPANPADVQSIDAIIDALYDVISGDIGEARNWNRMRSLFVPGGKLMPLAMRPGGQPGRGLRVLEVNDYIAVQGATLERIGFTERELARRVEQYGHIAHVWSTYEGLIQSDGNRIRGINSIQLLNDGTRWWIINVYWEQETPQTPLPREYLPAPSAEDAPRPRP